MRYNNFSLFNCFLQEMDFGTIMCWADNNVGQQKEPCVFHLIAAGKPEAPTNCTVVNQTSDSLEVYCLEGENTARTQRQPRNASQFASFYNC